MCLNNLGREGLLEVVGKMGRMRMVRWRLMKRRGGEGEEDEEVREGEGDVVVDEVVEEQVVGEVA